MEKLFKYSREWNRGFNTKKAVSQTHLFIDEIPRILNNEKTFTTEKIRHKWEKELGEVIDKLSNVFGDVSYENYEMVTIILNYMHVHNNRLGILPAEEIYLATILYECLIESV